MSEQEAVSYEDVEVAAECLGVKVPGSRFLHAKRVERINAAEYEGHEIRGALHVVREDDVVLEIGAGLGIVGAVIASNAKPKSVHSFEANPDLIPTIERLYELNGLEGVNSVRNTVLLSDPERPASIPFHLRNSFLGSSLIEAEGRVRKTVDVPTASFGETSAELGATVLIMDIEGGELELLRHAGPVTIPRRRTGVSSQGLRDRRHARVQADPEGCGIPAGGRQIDPRGLDLRARGVTEIWLGWPALPACPNLKCFAQARAKFPMLCRSQKARLAGAQRYLVNALSGVSSGGRRGARVRDATTGFTGLRNLHPVR